MTAILSLITNHHHDQLTFVDFDPVRGTTNDGLTETSADCVMEWMRPPARVSLAI